MAVPGREHVAVGLGRWELDLTQWTREVGIANNDLVAAAAEEVVVFCMLGNILTLEFAACAGRWTGGS